MARTDLQLTHVDRETQSGKAIEDRREDDAQFGARQVLPDADVCAVAKGKVALGIAGRVERLRILEHSWVPVGS